MEFTEGLCRFRMIHPKTLKPSKFYLDKPIESLREFSKGLGLSKIDLKTYTPTGLRSK